MSESYNLQDLYRKNLIWMPEWHGSCILDVDKLLFLDAGWVYHYNAIPPSKKRDANYWMERTYKELYK